MENQISKVTCGNCKADAYWWGAKNNHNLFSCIKCRLIFVDPLPNSENIYTKDYFSGAADGFGYVNYDIDKEPMKATFNKYIDLFDTHGKPQGKLLDIGAATGFFLSIAKSRGYEVSGVEISDYASNIARKRGIDVKTGNLTSSNFPDGFFDVITMFDVLEHIKDPFAELLEAKKILKKDGLLVINSPNGQSLMARFLKTKWHLILPPEHLFYFSPKNLSLFLEKSGFKVVYNGHIGKRFTFQYIFKMLYKWQKLSIWNFLSNLFSKSFLSSLYIPINFHDNFSVIFRKVDD